MSHFKPEDFPVLGETIKPSGENKKENKEKKDKQREQEIQDIVHEETSSKFHKECFVCVEQMGIFPRGEWSYQVCLHGKGLCEGCCSRTPRIEILKRYIDETKPEQCRQWMESHGGSLDELQTVSEWVIKDVIYGLMNILMR